MSYNGGSVVAMIGKDCVAIACDMRLGQQSIGVAYNFEKVSYRCKFLVQPSLPAFVGLPRQ